MAPTSGGQYRKSIITIYDHEKRLPIRVTQTGSRSLPPVHNKNSSVISLVG